MRVIDPARIRPAETHPKKARYGRYGRQHGPCDGLRGLFDDWRRGGRCGDRAEGVTS